MGREVATLEKGGRCCGWNYCGQRLAVGCDDGTVSVDDSLDASFSRSSQWKAHGSAIMNVVWVPPEFGDAIACICVDGMLSLWEEVEEDFQPPIWKQCIVFESTRSGVLDLQFGVFGTSLKLVAAHSDGHVKVFELLEPLELNKWQLQSLLESMGGAESLPTVTNLLVVLGLREALRKIQNIKKDTLLAGSETKKQSSV